MSKAATLSGEIHPWVAEGEQRVRFGLFGPVGGSEWGAIVRRVRLAEELGFDTFFTADHPVEYAYDPWVRLSALAALTNRIRLGTLVTCAYYRHLLLLARHVADLNEVSGGRVVLGLGIGDAPREFEQLGLPYPPARERQAFLAELLEVLPRLLRGEFVTYAGSHVRLEGARLAGDRLPVPRVPILVAGGGEKTLGQVAQLADASNFGPAFTLAGHTSTSDDVRRKIEALRAHCAATGRRFDSVLRTYFVSVHLREGAARSEERHPVPGVPGVESIPFIGGPEDAVEHFQAVVDAGFQYFVVGADEATMHLLAERVAPRLLSMRPTTSP